MVTGALVAAVFMLVMGVLGEVVVLTLRVGPGVGLAATAVAVAFAAAVGLAAWRPAIALGVAWAAAIGQMISGAPVLPADLAVLVVLFGAGASRSRPLRVVGVVSAVVGAAVAALYLSWPYLMAEGARAGVLAGLFGGATLVTLALSWTFGYLFATLRRAREARRDAAAAEREAIAEQERGRIARDMHDVVAHSLAVIVAQADGARYLEADERSKATLGTISTVAREALGDVRVLLERLRHSQGELPQPGTAELEALVAQVRSAGLDVVYAPVGMPVRLSAATDIAVYRLVQESLTNALRHGDATRSVRVALEGRPDEIRLEVRSALRDGALPGPAGHGLLGMRERARLAGGEFGAGAEDGEFVVQATLPAGASGGAV